MFYLNLNTKLDKMRIEYILEDDEGNNISRFTNIDITEEQTIKELITKLHSKIDIPLYKELIYGTEKVKVECSHFVKSSVEEDEYDWVEDLDKKVHQYPKCGKEGNFCIYIEEDAGRVN